MAASSVFVNVRTGTARSGNAFEKTVRAQQPIPRCFRIHRIAHGRYAPHQGRMCHNPLRGLVVPGRKRLRPIDFLARQCHNARQHQRAVVRRVRHHIPLLRSCKTATAITTHRLKRQAQAIGSAQHQHTVSRKQSAFGHIPCHGTLSRQTTSHKHQDQSRHKQRKYVNSEYAHRHGIFDFQKAVRPLSHCSSECTGATTLFDVADPLKEALPADFSVGKVVIGVQGEPNEERLSDNMVLGYETPEA